MATIGNYAGALGSIAKDAAKGAGNAFVGGLKGAVLREMPGVTAGMAFGKELSKRANAPKMQPGGAPPTNQQASTSSAMGGFGASVTLVAGQNKSNVINIEQVRQLKQLNDAVANQSKMIGFQIADQKRKDQFAEEAANEQAFRDDELLKAIKNIGAGFGGGAKNKNAGGSEGSGGSGLSGLIGDYGKELALGGLAVLFRRQIASMLARIVASPLTGMAVNAAIAGGSFLASIGTGFAAALRTVVTIALRALVTNPIGLAALGLGALFVESKRTEEKQKQQARDNNQAVAPMPTKTYADEAKQLREQARLEKDKTKQAELYNKAQLAQNNVNQEKIAASPLSLANRQKDWKKDWDKTHNPDGTPKVVKSSDYLANLARAESANDPNAKNPNSTATGLYQFLGDPKDKNGNPIKNKDGTIKEGTWKTTVRSMMAAGVLSEKDATENYLDDEFRVDPVKATKVAAYFTEQNRIGLVKALGRDPTQADLYMAHFMGLGTPDGKTGAVNFLNILKTNPNGNAALVNASAAESNPEIFYHDGKGRTKPRTVSEVYEIMSRKIGGNNSSIGPQTSDKDKKPSTGNVPVTSNTPKGNEQGAPGQPPAVKIDNSEADNYYKSLGISSTGKGGSTSNIGIDLVANKIADRMDAEAGANTIDTGDPILNQILAAFSAPFDKNKYGRGIQLAAGPGFNLGMGGGGTIIEDDKPILVLDEQAAKDRKAAAKAGGYNVANGSPVKSNVVNDGIARQTAALKPLFRNNNEIIADTNKTFLQQFRSTATGIFTQAITEGLFPNGTGVSASEAGREDNYRGQKLQEIFGTNDIINEATTKLLGKQYGPMFAPLFNNLAQGYLEVGSRVAGSAIFQGIGGLGAQETQTITGQVLGNFAAGNKKLALEQLLYGASGGKESGIALGPETLLAKYGFKNPAEGIQYFSSVLGEKVTQPFSKLMGADDRSKSIVWNPRAGKDGTGAFVYVDSGREASKEDIDKMGNYGAPVSQTTMIPDKYNNYKDPYGPGLGPLRSAGSAGSASAYRQVVDPNTGRMVAPSKRQILNLSNEEYMRDKEGNDRKADIQIELMRQQADAQAKIGADALKAAGEREAKRLEVEQNYEKAADVRTEANAAAVNHQAAKGAESIVIAVEKAGGIEEGGASPTKGLNEPPKKGDTVRKSGQLFGGEADGKGGVSPLSGMQEIGNFAFDMGKNMLGQQLTQNIQNPYMQMVANFAIQKGLNYVTDKFLGPLLDKGASALLDTGGSFIMDTVLPFLGFAGGGPVVGSGAARVSNGEVIVDAKTAKENFGLLSLMNSLGLSSVTDALGITGTTGQGHQVVSSSGVYNGFSMARGPDGTMVVDKPGYYDAGKSIASFGKSVVDFGGILGGLIPGKTAVGVAAQLIGGMMTAPFDRQQDFYSNMESGILGGAMSIGNGNYAMMDGTVRDSTGTTIGGTWTDSSGNDIRSGGGSLSFGVGSNYSAQIASNMSSISESSQNSMAGSDVGPSAGPNGVPFASGGSVIGPGSGTSDSIPAMLSNGEFVVNAKAAKAYRPILDALNIKHLANGTPAASGSVKDMAKVLGTAETNNQLAISNDTLSSIDNSLLSLTGGRSSGTSVSGYGGTAFDIGLGSPYAGSVSSGAGVKNGVARSRPTQQGPSTMDYVEAIGKQLLINKGISMASTALFGASPLALAGNFASGVSTGFTYGANAFAGDTIVAAGTQSGVTVGSSIAEFFGIGGASTAGAGTTSAAVIAAEAGTATAAGATTAAAGSGIGASLAAAAPYLLAAVAVFMIVDSYSGGGSAPPPKEPKFHAAIYVAGNNNISAIAPIYETTEYHAVPDVFKTVAYGLLKVAFNATKTSEKITNTSAPYDWVYMKVQHDRVSMLWGKGAPNPATLIDDGASEVKRWPALEESTNLSAYASDILTLVRDEFKKTAKTENLSKLDQAADALGGYSLHSLSSGLVSDLKSGNYKLDTSIEKGIYADNVAESNRISELIRTSAAKAAYITTATADTYEENSSGGQTLIPGTAGGVNMVYSMKQKKFVKNPYGLDVILLDDQDRPVYNIEGTSAGLSVEDFVSASVAGANRSANILQPPPATTGAGGAGSTNNTVVGGATIDNSSVTNFVNSLTTVTDVVRSTTNQVGVTG